MKLQVNYVCDICEKSFLHIKNHFEMKNYLSLS